MKTPDDAALKKFREYTRALAHEMNDQEKLELAKRKKGQSAVVRSESRASKSIPSKHPKTKK